MSPAGVELFYRSLRNYASTLELPCGGVELPCGRERSKALPFDLDVVVVVGCVCVLVCYLTDFR